MTLIYDKDGKFVNKVEPAKKSEVKIEDLKKEIKENVAKDFAGFTINKAIKVDDNGVVTYHIYIAKENEKINLLYDKDGKFIKKNVQGKGPNMKKDNNKKEEPKK